MKFRRFTGRKIRNDFSIENCMVEHSQTKVTIREISYFVTLSSIFCCQSLKNRRSIAVIRKNHVFTERKKTNLRYFFYFFFTFNIIFINLFEEKYHLSSDIILNRLIEF